MKKSRSSILMCRIPDTETIAHRDTVLTPQMTLFILQAQAP